MTQIDHLAVIGKISLKGLRPGSAWIRMDLFPFLVAARIRMDQLYFVVAGRIRIRMDQDHIVVAARIRMDQHNFEDAAQIRIRMDQIILWLRPGSAWIRIILRICNKVHFE